MRLLAIANNRWRDQMVADLRKVMKLNRHNSLLKAGRIDESLKEHRAIVAAIKARELGTRRCRGCRSTSATDWKRRTENVAGLRRPEGRREAAPLRAPAP